MSEIVAVPSYLAGIAARVKAGESDAAKRMMGNVTEGADERSLVIIGWCLEVLETSAHETAIKKLRWAWQYRAANEQEQALIAACVPEKDNGAYRGAAETPAKPSRYGRGNYQAPRDNPSRRTRRRAPRPRREAERDRNTARYFDEEGRAGEAEGQQLLGRDERRIQDEPYASNIDFDNAAKWDVRGLACVHCWGERAVADAVTERVLDDGQVRHGDDGLCSECRDSKRPGVPQLPAGHTLRDAVAARGAFLLEHYPASARGILIDDWQRVGPDSPCGQLIEAWAKAHLDDLVAARCAFIVERHPVHARRLLGGDWQGADSRRRALIEAWVEAHPLPEPASPDRRPAEEAAKAATLVTAPAPAGTVDGLRCECCGDHIHQVRLITSDDEGTTALCMDCRKLDSEPALAATPSAAAEAA